MSAYELAGCAGLSIQRVTGRRTPVAPTNDERGRVLRQILPSPQHNAHDWPHCQAERYSREQFPED